MPNVGYGYQPRGVIDLAGVGQRQQQINLQKQQLQQEQMWKVIDAVTEAYKEQEKIKKFKEMVAKAEKEGYGLPTLSTNAAGEVSATYKPKSYADVAKEAKAVSDIAGYQQEEQFQQTAGRLMEAPSPMGMQRGPRNPMEQMRTQLAQAGRGLSPTAKGFKSVKLPVKKQAKDVFTQAKIEQVKGAFAAGGVYSGGLLYEMEKPKLEEYALTQLGPNWKQYIGETSPKSTKSQYKVGDIISKGNKKYRVVRFDTDGEPMVDLVR